jgi:hypothetical protein
MVLIRFLKTNRKRILLDPSHKLHSEVQKTQIRLPGRTHGT